MQLYPAVVVISLSAVLMLEALAPLHATPSPPLRRWAHNFALSALAVGVTLTMPFVFRWVGQVWPVHPIAGGMTTWGLPVAAQWLITFLLLESCLYAFHRLAHRVPWLWRLHAVHHSDTELDATTTHRHHPLENLAAALFTLPVLWWLGLPWAAVLSFSLLAVLVSTVSHGNLRLPEWLDRPLRWLIVTPAYHRVHHSAHQPQTDSNYATLLTVWDHLLRTASAAPADRARGLTIGLDYARAPADQTVVQLLAWPFTQPPRAGPGRSRAV